MSTATALAEGRTNSGGAFVVVVCVSGSAGSGGFHNVMGPFTSMRAARNYVRGLRDHRDYPSFRDAGGSISARPVTSPNEEP